MERIRQIAPDKEELAAIIDYNESNLDTHRNVVIYGDNAPIRFSDLSENDREKPIKDVLPKDILDKYNQNSLHFSQLLRNHNPESRFMILTGIPLPQDPNS